jgi:predicted Zn-dependent peptidase
LCRKVVAAAGAVDHDELVKLSEDAFGSLSTDPTTAYDLVAKVRVLTLQSSHPAETWDISGH